MRLMSFYRNYLQDYFYHCFPTDFNGRRRKSVLQFRCFKFKVFHECLQKPMHPAILALMIFESFS